MSKKRLAYLSSCRIKTEQAIARLWCMASLCNSPIASLSCQTSPLFIASSEKPVRHASGRTARSICPESRASSFAIACRLACGSKSKRLHWTRAILRLGFLGVLMVFFWIFGLFLAETATDISNVFVKVARRSEYFEDAYFLAFVVNDS